MSALRVLLADPDSQLREMYRNLLASYGFEVATAGNGSQCLDSLRQFHPHVLILEPELPWGQGEGMVGRIYEQPDVPQVPVMLLCAGSTDEQIATLRGLPIREAHMKPVQPSHLAERIRRLAGAEAASVPGEAPGV
jgi:DNA-binding response OmpR family regulator